MATTPEAANDLAQNLIRLIKLMHTMRQHVPRLHPAVDPLAYPLLFNLNIEARRVSGLAECVHSDVSTVSRQVSTLVTHGLVAKVTDPEDGRAQVLTLTDAGSDLLRKVHEQRGEWFQTLLADWSDDEIAQFTAHLGRLADTVEEQRSAVLQSPDLTPEHT